MDGIIGVDNILSFSLLLLLPSFSLVGLFQSNNLDVSMLLPLPSPNKDGNFALLSLPF